jgi:hypothetical protein
MQLINGKFFRDGVPVPLEFGNMEQVRLIEGVKLLKEEGAMPAFIFDEAQNYICGISLTCVCGHKVQCHWETKEEGYEIEGTEVKCTGCDFVYEVCSDEDAFLFFKIVSKKKSKLRK